MKKNMIIIILVILFIAVAALFIGRGVSEDQARQDRKLEAVTTLFPLYDFAKTIGGDKVSVSLLLPPGVEAHSFEPKPSDIIKINKADIFIYTGKNMEPWVGDIIGSLSGQKPEIIDSSDGVKLLPAVFHDADEPDDAPDPHIWLDFDNDKLIVDKIASTFAKADPANTATYQNNANTLKTALDKLDADYRSTIQSCQEKTIVYGGHYALGYLTKRYDLKYVAAQGLAPDSEPTAKDLASLINQVNQENISHIFYEELSSPKVAETIARESQAKLLLLNAGHNISRDQLDNGISFLGIMYNNLDSLKSGLNCR